MSGYQSKCSKKSTIKSELKVLKGAGAPPLLSLYRRPFIMCWGSHDMKRLALGGRYVFYSVRLRREKKLMIFESNHDLSPDAPGTWEWERMLGTTHRRHFELSLSHHPQICTLR